MNERQAYALTHPLNDAEDTAAMLRLRAVERHKGFLIMSILAVDR